MWERPAPLFSTGFFPRALAEIFCSGLRIPTAHAPRRNSNGRSSNRSSGSDFSGRGKSSASQSRLDTYGRLAERLIDEEKAYRCYVTAEELGRKREEARGKGEVFRYRREWSQLGAAPGKPYAVRLSVSPGKRSPLRTWSAAG